MDKVGSSDQNFPLNAPENQSSLLKLTQVISEIVTLQTPQALYKKLGDGAASLFAAKKLALLKYSPQLDEVKFLEIRGITKSCAQAGLPLVKKTFAQKPKKNSFPFVISDLTAYDEPEANLDVIRASNIRAIALYPILSSSDALDILMIFYESPHHFSAEEIDIGTTLVRVAGSTLQKIQLIEDAQLALEREKQFNDINHTLNNATDLPTIFLSVVRMSAQLVDADAGILGVLIDSEMMTFYPYNMPANIQLRPAVKGRGVAWEIVETRKSIWTHDYFSLNNAEHKWRKLGIYSFIGVPLKSGDQCLGALTLFKMEPGHFFSERDLRIVEMIGRQAATTMQNIHMFREANHRANALSAALTRQSELDKMKNQFIQSVSHELRSPLGIIFGHAELLEDHSLGELNESQQESVDIISRRVRMLNDLVNDLTALLAAETQELRRDLIDTRLFLTAVTADHRIKAEAENICLHIEIEADLPWIYGDQTHLHRVFDNLFSNAFKFTPADGHIFLRVAKENDNVRIEVEDTGEGIDPKALPHIFERFYQVHRNGKPRRQGTGLGLALVKEIVEAHRGTVSVNSEQNQGTTFIISLPGHQPTP